MIVLIDSGSTQSFNHRVVEEMDSYVHAVNNFHVEISNGGTRKCGGNCKNMKLEMGVYLLKYPIFSFDIGRCDIIFGNEWLCNFAPIAFDFK
jgi:hypothetical protein